jgi:hypothetical protein
MSFHISFGFIACIVLANIIVWLTIKGTELYEKMKKGGKG